MSGVPNTTATPRSPADRALSLFADVRGGEAPLILALTANIFIVMVAYYVLKVVREPLVLTDGAFGLKGAALKNAAAAGQALLLLAVVPLYAMLAARVGRIRLINIVTAIFVGCLAVFALLTGRDLPLGFIFFIWLGIFNMMVVAQFWSFANDLYTPEAGRRVFAIVLFGQNAGAFVGSEVLAGRLVPILSIGQIMLVTAGLLVAAAGVANAIDRMARRAPPLPTPSPAPPAVPPETKRGGFRLVWKSRYLTLIALMMLVYNTVNTNGEFILSQIVTIKAHEEVAAQSIPAASVRDAEQKIIGVFYAGYLGAQSLLTLILQLFIVSRVLKLAGVRRSLLVMPLISMTGYGIIAIAPLLWLVRAAKVVENSIDYSLQNTARQTLFLPTSRAEKYQAKAAIDTFFVRMGDVVSFAIISLVSVALGLGPTAVALINMVLVFVWIALTVGVGRRHDRLVGA